MTLVRTSRVASLAAPLLCAVLLLPACGGGESNATAGNHPAPPADAFPSAQGKSLFEVMNQANGPTTLVLTPTQQVYYPGTNRFGFGVFTRSAKQQVSDAQIALYVAKAPPPGSTPKPSEKGAGKGALGRLSAALGGAAHGPYPAKVESLATEPAFQSQTTANDPDAGKVVYRTKVDLPSNGEWRVGALIRNGDKLNATLLPSATVGRFTKIPRVGQRPPDIHTPTVQSVGGDLSKLTTRIPPETMNKVDFHDVLGKKPIVLLFATPQFCQSRVCGPVVDIASQVQREFGDKAEFIHMEIYKDNDPSKGVRPQVRAFNLPSEPWLFVIDRKGTISTAIEGAFDLRELTDAVKKVTSG
jgi:hypothetical protein